MPHEPVQKTTGAVETVSSWRSHYVLFLLTIIYALNYLDRNIFSIVLQSIKNELALTDTTLGLLGGLAFAMFYATMGIPIAYLADRYSRRTIIAIGLSVWSLMTALTGMVVNVWQLALTRFLMGAGEATGPAPSNSLLADLYDKSRRPLAISILTSGSTIGIILGYLLGGWVNEVYGWRVVYLVAGIPGLVMALIFYLTVREPARGAAESGPVSLEMKSLSGSLRFLLGSKTYIYIVIGGCLMGVYFFGNNIWSPAFLMRVHGLDSGETGSYLALARGPIGICGTFMGGFLAERLGRRDERWRVWIPALGCLFAVPAEIVFLFSETLWLAVTGMVVGSFFTHMHLGPLYAVLLSVAAVRVRAVAVAFFLFCANLVGQTVGPLGIGYLNDVMQDTLGVQAIRYSLLIGAAFSVAGGVLIWLGARYAVQDMKRALES